MHRRNSSDIQEYNQAAGRELRRLRRRAGLRLQQAAAAMQQSAAMLSRRERGQEKVRRHDIQRAIAAYRLTESESYSLWFVAGLLPEPAPTLQDQQDVRQMLGWLLAELALPGLALDRSGQVCAWTPEVEAVWPLSQITPGAIHLVEGLFAPLARQRLGSFWEAFARQMLQVFYQRTLPIANDPTFRDLLRGLRLRYGHAFTDGWNQAHAAHHTGGALAASSPATLAHASAAGPIRYVLAQNLDCFPPQYAPVVWVPASRESLERYEQFRAGLADRRLHLRL